MGVAPALTSLPPVRTRLRENISQMASGELTSLFDLLRFPGHTLLLLGRGGKKTRVILAGSTRRLSTISRAWLPLTKFPLLLQTRRSFAATLRHRLVSIWYARMAASATARYLLTLGNSGASDAGTDAAAPS